MTAQHFTELIETIKISTAISENELGRRINSSGEAIRYWKKNGLPVCHAPMICNRLRKVVREAV